MTSTWLWYYTRGTGVVALVLLTATVVLGIVGMLRWSSPHWPRFVTQGLHRNLSIIGVAFVAMHIVTSVVDGYVPLRWRDAVVPFVSAYRPIWLGFGAVAVDLMLALILTSLVRARLGLRAWRAVHWLAYAAWPVAVVHGLGTGSDTRQPWSLALNGACLAAVLVAVWIRLAVGWPSHARLRVTAGALSAVLPVIVVVWLAVGPLAPGWASRAGTPKHVGISTSNESTTQSQSDAR